MLTCVLLNVARMFAMPVEMFFAPLALMIFFPLRSSASNSAAVGAAAATAAPSAGFGAAASGTPSAGAAFLGFAPSAGAAFAVSATPSGLASFFAAGFFFVSSAIGNQD